MYEKTLMQHEGPLFLAISYESTHTRKLPIFSPKTFYQTETFVLPPSRLGYDHGRGDDDVAPKARVSTHHIDCSVRRLYSRLLPGPSSLLPRLSFLLAGLLLSLCFTYSFTLCFSGSSLCSGGVTHSLLGSLLGFGAGSFLGFHLGFSHPVDDFADSNFPDATLTSTSNSFLPSAYETSTVSPGLTVCNFTNLAELCRPLSPIHHYEVTNLKVFRSLPVDPAWKTQKTQVSRAARKYRGTKGCSDKI